MKPTAKATAAPTSAGQPASYSFSGVACALPAKVRGSEAEEEWQEVDWNKLSTGTVRVDAQSWLLTFTPSEAGGALNAKPLGCLTRASSVNQDERELVVSTSDSIHKLYRLIFVSSRDAQEFSAIARLAEAATARGVPEEFDDADDEEALATLEAEIWQRLDARWVGGVIGNPASLWSSLAPPLVYTGAELYGAQAGVEVLIGRGALVLLDPSLGQETPGSSTRGRVGSYELVFFGADQGARQALSSFTIGPKTSLRELCPDAGNDERPSVSFEFFSSGAAGPKHTIVMDKTNTAASFARDLLVRKRLMDLASRTSKGLKATDEVRSELDELRRQSLSARLMRAVRFLVVLICFIAVVRLALFYKAEPGRPPMEYTSKLLAEARGASTTLTFAAQGFGSKACELFGAAVGIESVRSCAALVAPEDTRRCLRSLLESL